MANIVVLDSDPRGSRLVENYLHELDPTNRVFIFNSCNEFTNLYFDTDNGQNPAPAHTDDSVSEGREFQLVSTVHALIVRLDLLNEAPRQWLEKTNELLKTHRYFPKDHRTRIVFMKYDDDGTEVTKLLHPYLDDILFFPIDRLLFLQKMQILLGLPHKSKPQFLFFQEGQMAVDISKRVRMRYIHEMGLKIENPRPMKLGLLVKIYLCFPDEPNRNHELWAQVLANETSATGDTLSTLGFVMVNEDFITRLRGFLRTKPNFKNFVSSDPSEFEINPHNLTRVVPPAGQVLIIEPRADESRQYREQLTEHIHNIKILESPSLQRFINDYVLPKESAAEVITARPLTMDDLYMPELILRIQIDNHQLIAPQFKPGPGTEVLGHDAPTLLQRGTKWLELFTHQRSRDILTETLNTTLDIGLRTQSMMLTHLDGTLVEAQLETQPHADQKSLILKLRPLKAATTATDLAPLKKVDLLIIDQAFIPTHETDWAHKLNASLAQAGLVARDRPLKIIVTGPHPATTWLAKLQTHSGLNFGVPKNGDLRRLTSAVSHLLAADFSMYRLNNLGWIDLDSAVHLAKPSMIEGISEFGSMLINEQSISPGTILYIHGGLFAESTGGMLPIRFYFTEAHPLEKHQFRNHFIYVGITDQFLKYSRNWIKERYIELRTRPT